MGDHGDEGYPADGERPVHAVELPDFWIYRAPVTNAQFMEFVEATGYVTAAERFGSSAVFHIGLRAGHEDVLGAVPAVPWWLEVRGADWRHPRGPGGDLDGLADHPVVHVSWDDAQAYCRWVGRRLLTEAEWEYAARGGLVGRRFPWGDELTPGGEWRCNIWQGNFPDTNTAGDGYVLTSPVGSYPPNGYDLVDMAGNVWEWCVDRFAQNYYARSPRREPRGSRVGATRVVRGGSFLCHESYCHRYRVAARSQAAPDSSTSNTGFGCANDADGP